MMLNTKVVFRRLSIAQLSLIIGGLFFVAIGVVNLGEFLGFSFHARLLKTFLVGLLFFVVIYFLLLRFFNEKIKPLYKITEAKVSYQNNFSLTKDILADIQQGVNQLQKQRLSDIDRLKELEKYRREFLGNVMHELKTPLFNIQGYILTLIDGGIDDPNINMLYLKRAEKSVNRIISIVDDLEAISRLESGELKLNIEPFDLLKVVQEVFEIHWLIAKDRQIELRVDDTFKKVMVLADKKQISVVLSNLVVNAIKYNKKGGYVEVNFYDMTEKWMIEVKDNGIGIDEVHLPRIFERFYRVDKGRSREEGGTGLGLSIVKHVIDAHNQFVTVKSKKGEGSSFAFTLIKFK